jgi:nitrogen fixation/metabolism regulation signal transduction histidine kinase
VASIDEREPERREPLTDNDRGESKRRSHYLVDRPFQLKYTAALIGLALIVAAPFSVLLFRELREAVDVGNEAGDAAKTAVAQVSLLNRRLEMETLLKYKDDPATQEATRAANAKAQKETDELAKKIAAQQAALATKSVRVGSVIGASMLGLLLALGALGIFFTHRVVGPIYRMRQLFREVADGKFSPYRPLRKGDELQDFFAEFSDMVEKLKARQRDEVKALTEALEKASKAGVSDNSLNDLRIVRDAMERSIAGAPSVTKVEPLDKAEQ